MKPDVTGLKTFKRYQVAVSELAKAFNTTTAGEGLEWIPTEWSSDLMQRVEVERRIASFFPRFTMPSKTYEWPIRGTKPTVYIKNEVQSTSPTSYRAGILATGKSTFTAKGVAGLIGFSDESDEDSIIPVLPTAKSELVSAFVDAEESALINGDDSGSHRDADVTDSDDIKNLFDGLRFIANAKSGEHDMNGAVTMAGLIAMLKLADQYAADPTKGFFTTSTKNWYTMMTMTEVKTIDLWGPQAAYMKGALTGVLGRPLFPTAFIANNLNASGVYDGITTDNTGLLYVYPDGFKIGERRAITLEVDKDIRSGLMYVVATQRYDFQSMVPSADINVVFMYDITA